LKESRIISSGQRERLLHVSAPTYENVAEKRKGEI